MSLPPPRSSSGVPRETSAGCEGGGSRGRGGLTMALRVRLLPGGGQVSEGRRPSRLVASVAVCTTQRAGGGEGGDRSPPQSEGATSRPAARDWPESGGGRGGAHSARLRPGLAWLRLNKRNPPALIAGPETGPAALSSTASGLRRQASAAATTAPPSGAAAGP